MYQMHYIQSDISLLSCESALLRTPQIFACPFPRKSRRLPTFLEDTDDEPCNEMLLHRLGLSFVTLCINVETKHLFQYNRLDDDDSRRILILQMNHSC